MSKTTVESSPLRELNRRVKLELQVTQAKRHQDSKKATLELQFRLARILDVFLRGLKEEHKGMMLTAISTTLDASFFEIDLPKNGEGLNTRNFAADTTNIVEGENYYVIRVLVQELLNHLADGNEFDRFEIVDPNGHR